MTAVLFDLDCTLVDRAGQIRQYARQFAEDFRHCLAPLSVDHMAEVIIQADGWGYRPSERHQDILANLTWRASPSLDDVTAHWDHHFASLAVTAEGAVEVLEGLQTLGIPLGIVTNGSVRSQEGKIDALDLRPYFQTIIVSGAVGVKKPHAEIFQLALTGLGVSAAQTWFVGDHPENDILGASRAGLRPVWLAGVHTWPDAHAQTHDQIHSLRELLPLIQSQP